MIETSDPGLRRYLERLETLAENPPAERHRPEILNFIEGLGESALRAGMTPADQDRLASGVMLRLYEALLKTRDHEQRDFLFQCLAVFGIRGLPFFLAYPRRLPQEEANIPEILGQYPPLIKALAVNDILAAPHDLPRELRDAAENLLPWLQKMHPRQAVRFLSALAEYDRKVSFAVQEALLSGAYGEALRSRFKYPGGEADDPDLPPAAEFIQGLCLFRTPETAELLISFLEANEVNPPEAVFKAFTVLVRPDDVRAFKAMSRPLLSPSASVQTGALLALAAVSPREIGRIFAAVYKKNKALARLIARLSPLLPSRESESFHGGLSGEQQKRALAETFAACAALDPAKAGACLNAAAADGNRGGKAHQALEALIPRPDPAPSYQEAFKSRKLKTQGRPDWESARSGNHSRYDLDGPDQARSADLSEKDYRGVLIKNADLSDRTARHADFSGAALEDMAVTNVFFSRADFSRALFKNVRFENCMFECCSFGEAEFHGCSLENVDFSRCALDGALFSDCTIIKTKAAESLFTGARLIGTRLLTSRMSQCDLTRLRSTDGEIRGVEFLRCAMENIVLERNLCESSSFSRSHFRNASISGLCTDSPDLLRLYRDSLLDSARNLELPGPLPDEEEAGALIRGAVEHWRFMYDLTWRRLAFMANNKRRIDWSREKLGEEKAKFMKLAPYLLHTEVFEHVHDIPPLPLSACVARYQPDLTTIELALEHFRRAELPKHQHDPVHIHGLYIIGSVGSVAQTPLSDLDYWVCYDAEDMPESMAEGLGYKLAAIEKWAAEVFGLEVHFFLMDLNLIRNNTFGFSDAESSGSAQALLLKEEFYRTAVLVAGKLPIWCVTEPQQRSAAHARMLAGLEKGKAVIGLVDLGGLKSIPREEFFGASLWQIVKALKSPFKSIMKFGLLEKYISSNGKDSPLLCEKFKHNLFSGRDSLTDLDPYVLLFQEVVEHYVKAGDADSLQMVQLSFALKSGLRGQIRKKDPLLRPEYKEIRKIFAGGDSRSPMHLSSLFISRDLSFDKLVSMGQKVNTFVLRTYTRVRDEQAGLEKVSITPEDLTILGRKIFAIFSKRKDKIEHIPFVSFSEAPFKVLHFSAQGGKLGDPDQWDIQGAQELALSQLLQLTNLRSGKCLPELLAWLTANEIYAPGMEIRGDYSISPVTTRDLDVALLRLRTFFPASGTFDADIAETMKPERVVRAFFILNLVKPRESADLLSVAVIYSTNWGELYCTTVETPRMSLKDPVAFLRQFLAQSVPEPPVMECFVPTRSKCPPIRLPAENAKSGAAY